MLDFDYLYYYYGSRSNVCQVIYFWKPPTTSPLEEVLRKKAKNVLNTGVTRYEVVVTNSQLQPYIAGLTNSLAVEGIQLQYQLEE